MTKAEAIEEIKRTAPRLLDDYRAMEDILYETFGMEKEVASAPEDTADLPDIDPDELAELYEAIREFAGMYDADSILRLLDQTAGYRVPEEDREKLRAITRAVQNGEWESVRTI